MITTATTLFQRYIGIDYSGAKTPTCSLPGLRVYEADPYSAPTEVPPPPSPKKYWTRRSLAEWLSKELAKSSVRTIVGIDHAFSFPINYFEKYGLARNWDAFLDDFQIHWPTDEDHTYVCFVMDGECGKGAERLGNSRWRRQTDLRAGTAKSPFHFGVPGSVASSTHAGLPWLRHLRKALTDRIHVWPFDGWQIPAGKATVVEVYPAIWSRSFPRESRNDHQHDAYSVAAWLRKADSDSSLAQFLEPQLYPEIKELAGIEGWILGVR